MNAAYSTFCTPNQATIGIGIAASSIVVDLFKGVHVFSLAFQPIFADEKTSMGPLVSDIPQ